MPKSSLFWKGLKPENLVLANTRSQFSELQALKKRMGDKYCPKMPKISEYIDIRATALLGHIFRSKEEDPVRQVVMAHDPPIQDNGEVIWGGTPALNIPIKFRWVDPELAGRGCTRTKMA